jgi:hypothetical protein
MPTQSRVPGAASSEVDFELERFERTGEDRIEISGRWYGLRGRRFVRPVLNLHTGGGSRRRAIALLEHKPWAADDGQTWLAAFAWPKGAGDVEGAELEVGPGLIVDLPAPGGKPGSQGRVSALRPHAPAPMARRIAPEGEDDESAADAGARDHDAIGPAGSDRTAERPQHDRGAGESAGSDRTGHPATRDRGAGARRADRAARHAARAPVEIWDTAPVRERAAAPPRDVMTAALDERDEAVAARDESERERVQALNDRDDALSRRDAALRDVERAIAERDEAIAQRDRFESELERVTRERDVADAERKRMMQDAEAVERQRNQAAAERDAARSELSRALPERDQAQREAEAQAARADRAESERETAFAERKTAVAQRDRARRERDRAMRAAGVEPPVESPLVGPQRHVAADVDPAGDADLGPASDFGARRPAAALGQAGASSATVAGPGQPDGPDAGDLARSGPADTGESDSAGAVPAAGYADDSEASPVTDSDPAQDGARTSRSAAAPPGTPLPSRPIRRIGSAPIGPTPEPKPLLTPVDSGRPRRLSRTRRPPSAPARWAVRIIAMLVLIAVVVVLAILLASVV